MRPPKSTPAPRSEHKTRGGCPNDPTVQGPAAGDLLCRPAMQTHSNPKSAPGQPPSNPALFEISPSNVRTTLELLSATIRPPPPKAMHIASLARSSTPGATRWRSSGWGACGCAPRAGPSARLAGGQAQHRGDASRPSLAESSRIVHEPGANRNGKHTGRTRPNLVEPNRSRRTRPIWSKCQAVGRTRLASSNPAPSSPNPSASLAQASGREDGPEEPSAKVCPASASHHSPLGGAGTARRWGAETREELRGSEPVRGTNTFQIRALSAQLGANSKTTIVPEFGPLPSAPPRTASKLAPSDGHP